MSTIKDLRRAAKAEPKNPDVWVSLGEYYLNNRDAKRALMYFERARKLEPDGGKYWMWCAYAKGFLGRSMEALKDLETALTFSRDNGDKSDIWMLIASMYNDLGRKDDALKAAFTSLEYDENNEGALETISLLKDPTVGFQMKGALDKEHPPETVRVKGALERSMNALYQVDFKEAERILRMVNEHADDEYPKIRFCLAISQFELGHCEKAEDTFRQHLGNVSQERLSRIIKDGPYEEGTWTELGNICHKLGLTWESAICQWMGHHHIYMEPEQREFLYGRMVLLLEDDLEVEHALRLLETESSDTELLVYSADRMHEKGGIHKDMAYGLYLRIFDIDRGNERARQMIALYSAEYYLGEDYVRRRMQEGGFSMKLQEFDTEGGSISE